MDGDEFKITPETSDEVDLILMRMKRDAEKVHKILSEYAHDIDKEILGKEGSE